MRLDTIVDVIGYLLLILAVGIIAAMFMVSTDKNIQTRLKDKSTSYVDSVRATGKITPNEYIQFVESINNCGEFTPSVKIARSITYRDDYTGEVKNDTIIISQAELLEYVFVDGGTDREYLLNTGDRVYVDIRRTGAGFTSLLTLIGQGGKEGDLISEYSGLVLHDGR